MVTTFFGAQSFGGDAAYVERLARALARAGHEVHVVHCLDAFQAVRGGHPLREFSAPEGVVVHQLESPWGILSPLATQTTGQPYFKQRQLKTILEDLQPDVIHFHNISLVGGPGLLSMGKNSIRLMTAHEHWLVCPMHLLWKYDSRPCDRPDCARCMLVGKRPPQLWRRSDLIARSLQQLDALIFPSRHALAQHQQRGISAPSMTVLPYFLPDGWPGQAIQAAPAQRPYLAAAGRVVKMKGFQQIIPLMRYLPEADLRIAGAGSYETTLRKLANNASNVLFEGLLGGSTLANLFAGAKAVVVPSLFPETFGYVVLEAFAAGTPVIVHQGGGALSETGVESGGGLGYSDDGELLIAMRRMIHHQPLRDQLARQGAEMRVGAWSEAAHLEAYFNLIAEIRHRRLHKSPPHWPAALGNLQKNSRHHDNPTV